MFVNKMALIVNGYKYKQYSSCYKCSRL